MNASITTWPLAGEDTTTTLNAVLTTVHLNKSSADVDPDCCSPQLPLILGVGGSCLFVISVILVMCLCRCQRRKSRRNAGGSHHLPTISGGVPMNAMAYRNYGQHLTQAAAEQRSTVLPSVVPDLPPSYEEAISAAPVGFQSPRTRNGDQGPADGAGSENALECTPGLQENDSHSNEHGLSVSTSAPNQGLSLNNVE